MKQFISNGINIYDRITSENENFFICSTKLYPKSDVITEYHPLDNMNGKLYLHIIPFYN